SRRRHTRCLSDWSSDVCSSDLPDGEVEVVSGWALPCAPYGGAAEQGFFFIPEVDAGVWVEFEAGNLDFPVWVGTFWSKPGGSSGIGRASCRERVWSGVGGGWVE